MVTLQKFKVKSMRKFNVTGICVPNMHYMVDISGKVEKVFKMVEEGYYFTILSSFIL